MNEPKLNLPGIAIVVIAATLIIALIHFW